MTTQEQENFYRHSTGIVDETKDSFLHLLDFHLTNQGITLQKFIEINGHVIYHLCFNRYPCCQCPPGTRAETRGSRVLHPPQLDILFDKTGSKIPGHNPRSKSAPHCCCPVNPNLKLQDLDFTLARLLLVNFTVLVPQGSPERNALDNLVKIRNESYGHAKEGKIPNDEYKKSMAEIEQSLLVLAKVYGMETETKQRLCDIAKQPLNPALCLQLQSTLLEHQNTLLQHQNTLLQQCRIDETIKQLLAESKLPEYLLKDLEDIRVVEGCDARLELWTRESGVSVDWFKGDNRIEASNKYVLETSGQVHRLVVTNAVLTDRGIYEARFLESKRTAKISIEEYFTKNMAKTFACIEGENVELSCAVCEDNIPAQWTKNGVVIQPSTKYIIQDMGKSHMLSIIHLDLQDSGDYSVTINNRIRSSSIQVKGYFTKALNTQTCIEGEDVQFECEVLYDNQTALWFKNGIEVSTSVRYKVERQGNIHRLVVVKTKIDDEGEYSVQIKNCVRHSRLIVQEMPTAIQHLSEEDKSLYLDIIKSGTETRYYLRIVIIGENGVGKTCLLRRLLKQSITGVQSTDGIDIHRCKICLRNGEWIFDEVSDKKKELLTRIKIASHSRTARDETLQDKADSLYTSGLQDDDGSENSKRESPNVSLHKSVRKRKTGDDVQEDEYLSKRKRRTSKDQSLATTSNFSEDFAMEVDEESNSQPITKLLTEHILQGLDDLLNGIEKLDVPADKFVECGILDFAGEKEYYATHPVFLNPNAVHLLVVNIMKDVKPIRTDDGFDKIGEYIDFWLDTVHSCVDKEELQEETMTELLNPPAIIVCTRIDECRDNLKERKNYFRNQLLSVLRNESKIKHVREVCYVSNTESDEEDFNYLRNTVFKYGRQVKTFAERLPLRWIRLEQSIDVLREAEVNILSWLDIVQLSSKCSIDSEVEIKLFLKYQHNVGGVIYFESLKEYIILNQKWLANAFRCLVSDKFDSNLKLTDEWRALEDTGKLEQSLIVKLFDKEPELDFNKHSGHLLNVMEIFGIIVKLTTLMENGQRNIIPTYYMPCMIAEKATFTDIIDRFNANKANCKRTPWLCIEFNFMPFDFFNHILCYYISTYPMCTEPQTGRMAIYHGMGVFFLDSTKFRKFILCFCKNTVALQIWQSKNVEKGKCKVILEELKATIERVKDRFETRRVFYTVKSKCSEGNIHMSACRHSYSELLDSGDDYFCEEHSDSHNTQDFFQTWFEDYTENEDFKKPSIKFEDTDLRGIVNAKEFKELLSQGSYESFWNRIYLAGACSVGKTTLASLLIGEDIPQRWNSTDGLRIYFGRNGIDLKTKKMIPLPKDQGRRAVLTNVLRGKPKMVMAPSYKNPVINIAPKEENSSPSVAVVTPHAAANSLVLSVGLIDVKETEKPHSRKQVEKEKETEKVISMVQFSSVHEDMIGELIKGEYKVEIAPSDLVDFGGQRSYDMTHQLFIQSKGAFTLLFDARKGLQDPLDEYPQGDITTESILKHWVDSILTYCGDRYEDDDILPVILFVATHSDMLTKDERLQKTGQFKEGLAKLFSNHDQCHRIKFNDIFFINGKDKDDLEVDRLKEMYVEVAFQQKSWGNKMPMAWVPLELQLSDMKTNNTSIIPKETLIDINKQSTDLALTEKQLDQFLKAQHAFGKILYFEGLGLDKYIIVQPTTLVDILRSFITDEMFWPKDDSLQIILKELRITGMIKKEDLFTLWSQPEFSLYMPNDDFKEFVMKVLTHLDLLVEPKRFKKNPCQNVFLVPCIVKRLPPADFMKGLRDDNTICLSYRLLKSSIPSALSFKLIAAALNVWSLKKSKDGICLYHKAAIFCVDELNELYLLIKDDRVLVYFVNKSSKELISKQYASSAQECLTLAMTSSLEFYYSSFGKFVPKSAVSDLFHIEVGEICDTRTCCILLTEAKKEKVWKCEAGKNHSTVYPLYWVHDVKDENYKDGNCNVDCPGPTKCFMSQPTDKHLARLAGHIKIKSLERFVQTLGLSCDDWECLEHKHKGLPPQNMRIDALCEWKKKKEKPVYQDLYTALGKIGCDPHILCQIFREDSAKRVDINDVSLQEVPNDETLWDLSRNIGNCVHHLGIELGISSVEIEETINRYNKDMFEQNYDILLKWKKLSHVNKTIGNLMSVLKIVDLRGYTFLKEIYKK